VGSGEQRRRRRQGGREGGMEGGGELSNKISGRKRTIERREHLKILLA